MGMPCRQMEADHVWRGFLQVVEDRMSVFQIEWGLGLSSENDLISNYSLDMHVGRSSLHLLDYFRTKSKALADHSYTSWTDASVQVGKTSNAALADKSDDSVDLDGVCWRRSEVFENKVKDNSSGIFSLALFSKHEMRCADIDIRSQFAARIFAAVPYQKDGANAQNDSEESNYDRTGGDPIIVVPRYNLTDKRYEDPVGTICSRLNRPPTGSGPHGTWSAPPHDAPVKRLPTSYSCVLSHI
jgi:hypothetical protein